VKYTGKVEPFIDCGALGLLEMHIQYECDPVQDYVITKTVIPGVTLNADTQEILEDNLETSPVVLTAIKKDVARQLREEQLQHIWEDVQ